MIIVVNAEISLETHSAISLDWRKSW